jgi:hypothetical protein
LSEDAVTRGTVPKEERRGQGTLAIINLIPFATKLTLSFLNDDPFYLVMTKYEQGHLLSEDAVAEDCSPRRVEDGGPSPNKSNPFCNKADPLFAYR